MMPTLYDVKPDQQESGNADDANYRCHDDEQVHGQVLKSRGTLLSTSTPAVCRQISGNYHLLTF